MADFRGPWPPQLPPITTRDRLDDLPDTRVVKAHGTKFTVWYQGRLIGHVRRDIFTGMFGYQVTRGDRSMAIWGPFNAASKRDATVAMTAYIDSIGGDIDAALNAKALENGQILAMWHKQQKGTSRG